MTTTRNTRTASRLIAALLAALLGWAATAGCSNDECKLSSDCRAGYYCSDHRCVPFEDVVTEADVSVEADGDTDAPPVEADGEGGADADEDGGGTDADADTDEDGGGADADADVDGDGGCTSHAECGDGNPCTVDECLMATGVCRNLARADGEFCDDGVYCNGYETCLSGVCGSSGDPCADLGGTGCVGYVCDEGTPDCIPGNRPDGTGCDDGSYCNGPDACLGGLCTSGPRPCTGGDGICSFATCDETTLACGLSSAADGSSCDDGDICNGVDTCLGGVCAEDPRPLCDDMNPCTYDVCAIDGSGTVTCSYPPRPPGDACTPTDVCMGTTGNVCIAGSCAAGSDAPCTDGSLCAVVTGCLRGSCTTISPPPPVDEIGCGRTASRSTVTQRNDVAAYGATCGSGFTGGEYVFRITTRTDVTTLDLTLSDVVSSGPLSILALADLCDPASCVASSDGATTLSVPRGSAGQFYIVVDGAAGARGSFTLSAACR